MKAQHFAASGSSLLIGNAQSLFLLCPVRRAMTVDHASELLLLQVPAYDCAVISNDFGTNNLKRGDAYDLIVSDR